jgi:hypothetical protein
VLDGVTALSFRLEELLVGKYERSAVGKLVRRKGLVK